MFCFVFIFLWRGGGGGGVWTLRRMRKISVDSWLKAFTGLGVTDDDGRIFPALIPLGMKFNFRCPGRPQMVNIAGRGSSLFSVVSSGYMAERCKPSDGDLPAETCPTCWWSVSPAGTLNRVSTSFLTQWSACCSRFGQIELPCAAFFRYVNMVRLVGLPGRPYIFQDLSDHVVEGLVFVLSENSRINFGAEDLENCGPRWLGCSVNLFFPVQVVKNCRTQIGMMIIMLEFDTKHADCSDRAFVLISVKVHLPTACPLAKLMKVILEVSGIPMILDASVYLAVIGKQLIVGACVRTDVIDVRYEHKGAYDYSLRHSWFYSRLTGIFTIYK